MWSGGSEGQWYEAKSKKQTGADLVGLGRSGKKFDVYSNCNRKPLKGFKQECDII